ncbi:PepSY domain-containing protein [Virgibacillus ainsalahensis]
MSRKRVILAAALGVTVGYLAKEVVDNYQKVTAEKALKNAKEAFKKNGPISGSWIYMKPEEIEKNGLMYNAYRGGVTRNIDGEAKQYEFHVDVESGAVIDSVQTSS